MPQTTIALHRHPAPRSAGHPPLLFVHGGYTHAGGWQLNFIPFLNGLGYDCFAVDLSGHGKSGGREQLNRFGLDDYAEDLAWAVDQLDGAPVLIGHSMGSMVIERYLARADARAVAVALLAPVPPSGTGGSASRLLLQVPEFFAELPNAVGGTPTANTLRVMAQVYFSPDLKAEETEQYLPLIGPESDLAVAEMVCPPWRARSARPRIPALVMGGSRDAVFPASMLHFTAAVWQARTVVIEGAGHMLILDPQWPVAAQTLADWLDALPAA
ncbi:MAG: alpha/beta hydrolase [Azonexaceae bacterium]|uniref:alpha/beta hydrolase n=1 Tax=Azonexus sp. R2A61 TaxID=2744443 RepID=UPI001F277439|nr:alpha/beta hydrolase [Azonexus sp. R2A61]MCE1241034.1 alpha/beta hydrolase [Azonexaceae bacterium]